MARTKDLHKAFLRPLEDATIYHSSIEEKPLCVDLVLPNPPRLRVYMYTLVGGVGTVRPNEYKAVLRVPGQAVGAYDSFDHSDGRLALLVGYREDLDVFVLWDASLHPRLRTVVTSRCATSPCMQPPRVGAPSSVGRCRAALPKS